MPTLSRLTLATVIAGLLLAGCAEHPATRSTTTTATTTSSGSSTMHRDHAATESTRKTTRSTAASDANLPDNTGIPACDDYLSSYLACHRAAAIYAPDQLQSRYEAMRTSLLRDSQNPDIRPQLAARCNSLATQLRQALHGKSCADAPASASTAP
jgi:outer membrane murein-binding lipoprotein Lpp